MVHFNDNPNTTNISDNGSNNGKKKFPATPHPSKKHRTGGSTEDNEFPALPAASQSDSPQQQMTSTPGIVSTQDDKEEQDDSDIENNEEIQAWKQFEENTSEQDASNLGPYLLAKASCEAAKDRFRTALDECMACLNAGVEEMLQDLVVPTHDQLRGRCDRFEEDIISTMKSTHSRRKGLQNKLDKANDEWNTRYQKLMGQVLNSTEMGASNDGGNEVPARNDSNNTQNDTVTTKDDENGRDPDWNELAEYEPSRENVRIFLTTRDKLQASEDHLSSVLDEIHVALKAEVQAILQVAADLYDHHESICIDMEEDIQSNLMNNHKRRNELQKSLQDSAMQAQGLFAQLLARVSRAL